MPPATPITRPRAEYATLKHAMKLEKHAAVKQRMLMVLSRWDTQSINDIAAFHHVHRDTVTRWIKRFNISGIEGLKDMPRSGCPRKLSWGHIQQDLDARPSHFGYPDQEWTMKLLHHHLKAHYGVVYERHYLYRVLHHIGYSFLVPRPRHYKQDPHQVDQWKKSTSPP